MLESEMRIEPSLRLARAKNRMEARLKAKGIAMDLIGVISGPYLVKYQPEAFDLNHPGDAAIWLSGGGDPRLVS